MSYSANVTEVGVWTAAADLREKQGLAVNITATNAVNIASNGGRAVGILTNDPNSDEVATVAIAGVVKAISDGTLTTAGDPVAVGASGKVTKAASNDFVLGILAEPTTVNGGYVAFLIDKSYIALS